MTAALAIAAIGAVLTLALLAIAATRRAGNEKARGDSLAVRIEGITAQNTDLATRLKDEKARGDALDAAIVEAAAAGPVAGSFDRLLQARAGAAHRGAPAVPDSRAPGGETTVLGPDDLLPLE